MYIPSTLNTDYLLWQTQLIKIINHGLNHGLLFSLFNLFGWKNDSKLTWKFRIKLQIPILFNIQFYLMYRLICQKPANFWSAQMALVSTFFSMFIVLGIYNCYLQLKIPQTCQASNLFLSAYLSRFFRFEATITWGTLLF